MAYYVSGLTIIPTCLDGSCLPNTSFMTILLNLAAIVFLLALGRRHVLRKAGA